MQNEEFYQGLTYRKSSWKRGMLSCVDIGGVWLSSARAVRCWLSLATSAILVFCCHRWVWNLEQIAYDKSEEGEDEVKSSCPLCLGQHTCYNGRGKGSRSRECELTPKIHPQLGLLIIILLDTFSLGFGPSILGSYDFLYKYFINCNIPKKQN